MRYSMLWLVPVILGITFLCGVALAVPNAPGNFITGNGTVSEYAPDGTLERTFADIAGIRSVAVGPLTANFFAADGTNLYEINARTGIVSTIATPVTHTKLNQPSDIAFAANNRLYVTNRGTDSVLEVLVDIQGLPTYVLKSTIGSGYLTNPSGLAFNSGKMFVSSGTNNIVVLNDSFGWFTTLTPAGLTNPGGLAFGLNGSLYVVNTGGKNVLEVDPLTGTVLRTFSGNLANPLTDPRNIAMLPGGSFLVTDEGGVVEFDATTGLPVRTFAIGPVNGIATERTPRNCHNHA